MSARSVNLDTYSLSLLTAKEDILNPRSSTNWAIFAYDGVTNKLKLADSGAGGVPELAERFHISKPQYGLCKVEGTETGSPRIAMIIWVGQNVDDCRRTECASHTPAIKNFFKEAHVFIRAEKVEDVTEEKLRAELSKISAHDSSQWVRRSSRSAVKEEIVGTNYRKTNAAMEMRLINRDSFWARAEREEEERKDEDRRRASEERRRLERERVLKERRDAEERDRKMDEKLQMIEAQRRKQAEQDEELRRKEKFKWEQQQKEHEEDMRARLRRSESIEKAAEAAALVSQRSMNPREFFRQLSSSSSLSPTSPGSSRAGKPFRRYQRSLTDTAFIFCKAEESAASSPRSSPLVSPFSRTPHSPLYRTTSPPMSPDFRPVTSPQRPKAPMSPPTPPVHAGHVFSSMPTVPQTNNQVQAAVELKAPSPTEPSAPPASPTAMVSLSPMLVENHPSQSHSEALLAFAQSIPTQPVHTTFFFGADPPPQAPTAPLPERPQSNTDLNAATHVHTGLVSDPCYIAQTVLVEEDEEEDMEEQEKHKTETQPQPLVVIAESVQEEADVQEQDDEEEQEKEELEREEDEQELEREEDEQELEREEDEQELEREEDEQELEREEDEQEQEREEDEQEQETEEDEQEQEREEKEVEEAGLKQPALPEEPVEVVEEEEEAKKEEDNISEDRRPAELSEKEEVSAVTEPAYQEIHHDLVALSTNGITNGENTQEQNGIERSLSPSDTELSSQELRSVCYNLHVTPEEDDAGEDEEQEISENGEEVLAKRQMCVRALYDYQAEDESEISFEPGDIITDVETVDKAWWRGWSKDGRQGLFPANYVETV